MPGSFSPIHATIGNRCWEKYHVDDDDDERIESSNSLISK